MLEDYKLKVKRVRKFHFKVELKVILENYQLMENTVAITLLRKI